MDVSTQYLVPGERIVFVARRHSVVLGPAAGGLFVALAAAVGMVILSPRWPKYHLGEASLAVAAMGIIYFAWHTWMWWLSRYIITNERILLIEGLVARRIKSLPLRLIIDTTYHRTVPGRLLGYCDLDINLSGQPGLRRLTMVPHAEEVYHLMLRLLSKRDGTVPAAADRTGELNPAGKRGSRRKSGGGPVRSSRSQ